MAIDKMKNSIFQLDSAWFETDDNIKTRINFLGPSANPRKTHITLIAGANGTSKSRLLASLVDRLCVMDDERSETEIQNVIGSMDITDWSARKYTLDNTRTYLQRFWFFQI